MVHKPCAKQRGQSLLEFALVIPALLILILGIIEFGKVFVQYFGLLYTADNVAQASARLGGDGPALDAVQNNNRLPFINNAQVARTVNTLDTSGNVVCSTYPCTCNYGQVTRVRLSHPATIRILFIRYDLTLTTTNTSVCWRGGAP